MSKIVKCKICGKKKKITYTKQAGFRCCRLQQDIRKNLVAEGKPLNSKGKTTNAA